MATTMLANVTKSAAGRDSTVGQAIEALPTIPTNVSSTERWLSLAAGGALTVFGLQSTGPARMSAAAGAYLLYRAATGYSPLYHAIGVSTGESTDNNTAVSARHGTRVESAIIVMKSAAEAYDFWRDFENLPRFMTHLIDVNTSVGGKSHWIARGPYGLQVEWEAEIIEDKRGEVISWKSLEGADVDNAGSVHFRELPHNRGTEVRVNLKYDPPGGKVGSLLAFIVGKSPKAQIKEDLRHFKQILETGETPTVDGQSHGQR